MSDLATIVVAVIASTPPTIAAAAAFHQARSSKRRAEGAEVQATQANVEAAAANRAVNHMGPDEPTIHTKLDGLSTALAGVQANVGAISVQVVRNSGDLSTVKDWQIDHDRAHASNGHARRSTDPKPKETPRR